MSGEYTNAIPMDAINNLNYANDVMEKANYLQQAGGVTYESPSLRQRLLRQEATLELQLQNVRTALKFMDNNPDFEAFQDILRKVL